MAVSLLNEAASNFFSFSNPFNKLLLNFFAFGSTVSFLGSMLYLSRTLLLPDIRVENCDVNTSEVGTDLFLFSLESFGVTVTAAFIFEVEILSITAAVLATATATATALRSVAETRVAVVAVVAVAAALLLELFDELPIPLT